MNKVEMTEIVKANDKLNETELATMLLENDCSFQELSMLKSVMIDLGLRKDEAAILKDVKSGIKKSDLNKLDSYRVLREYAETLADKHSISVDSIIPVIKRQMKHHKMNAVTKVNLGGIKGAVVSYFKDNDKPDVDELMTVIVDCADMTPDKARLHCSQLYQLGVLLHRNQDLTDVN